MKKILFVLAAVVVSNGALAAELSPSAPLDCRKVASAPTVNKDQLAADPVDEKDKKDKTAADQAK